MPVDISERVREIISILSFLRVLRSDQKAQLLCWAFLWSEFISYGMLPASQVELDMSIYAALQDRYERREAALQNQVLLLTKAASKLAGNFRQYLGLPTPCWNRADGTAGDQYVRLGEGQAARFEEKPWTQLSAIDGVVSFSIALTMVSDDCHSRTTYVFPMSIEFVPTGYLVKMNDAESVLLTPVEVEANSFDEVYAKVVARLELLLDPSRVMISN